jgi:hypothetical protein
MSEVVTFGYLLISYDLHTLSTHIPSIHWIEDSHASPDLLSGTQREVTLLQTRPTLRTFIGDKSGSY